MHVYINVFCLIIPGVCLAQFSLNNVHKRGLKQHHFISYRPTYKHITEYRCICTHSHINTRSPSLHPINPSNAQAHTHLRTFTHTNCCP